MSRRAFAGCEGGTWRGLPHRNDSSVGGNGQFYFEHLKSKLSKYDSSLLMSFLKELENHNFLRIQSPRIPMPDYGGVLLEITPLGRQFVEHSNSGNI